MFIKPCDLIGIILAAYGLGSATICGIWLWVIEKYGKDDRGFQETKGEKE